MSFFHRAAGDHPGGPMPTRRFDTFERAGPIGLWKRGHREVAHHASDNLVVDYPKPLVLSVVIPAKNEALNLPQLIDETVRALRPLRHSATDELVAFEILVVNDGSTDETVRVLLDMAVVYPELRWLNLAATVGQTSAMIAGIRAAQGEWIATLDADLQNDPADLIQLWQALPGHDSALGWRLTRHDVISRRFISRWANLVRNAILGQSIRDTGCSVRIFSRATALRLPMFQGMHRFMGPLLLREGCNVIQVPVNHRPRIYGCSHYNLWNRSLQVIVDLLGVMWLLRRPVHYRVISVRHPESAKISLSTSDTVSAGLCA